MLTQFAMLRTLNRGDYLFCATKEPSVQRWQDHMHKTNAIEFCLATKLIKNVLGEDWWRTAEDEISVWGSGGRLREASRNPLTRYMTNWGDDGIDASTYVYFLNFAGDLLIMAGRKDSNLESKVVELRSSSFFQTWFELGLASQFVRGGLPARFIPSSNKEKRPDLEVDFADGHVAVECKARDRLTLEERNSEPVYIDRMNRRLDSVERLLLNAAEKFDKHVGPAMVAVSAEMPSHKIFTLEEKQLVSLAQTFLVRQPRISGVLLHTEEQFYFEDSRINTKRKVISVPNPITTWPLPPEFYQTLNTIRFPLADTSEFLAKYAKSH